MELNKEEMVTAWACLANAIDVTDRFLKGITSDNPARTMIEDTQRRRKALAEKLRKHVFG